jgi:hypothetical protein
VDEKNLKYKTRPTIFRSVGCTDGADNWTTFEQPTRGLPMINALLLQPVCCVGEDTLPGEQALHKMLGELGMTAPEPPVMPGLHNPPWNRTGIWAASAATSAPAPAPERAILPPAGVGAGKA